METQTFHYLVTFERDEDGIYIADVPALPGCHSFGATLEEAEKAIQESIAGYLEALQKSGDSISPPEIPNTSDFSLTKPVQVRMTMA